jgi:valyl-tRNA synthetase
LQGILQLLHPFMPHITEEIWQTLTQQPADLPPQFLALQAYPQGNSDLIDLDLEAQFQLLIDTIRTIRNLRAESDIKPGAKIIANLQSESAKERSILNAGQSYIQDLAKVETLTVVGSLTPSTTSENAIAGVVGTIQVVIPLEGVVDLDALRSKLAKSLSKAIAESQSLSARLGNPNFVGKAPADVVAGVRLALAEAEKQAEILRDRLESL